MRLDECRRDPSPTFLIWNVCYEFLRVTIHPRVLESPWLPWDAYRFISELLESPGFTRLVASGPHAEVLEQTMAELSGLQGNLMFDLHTAVLMREHGISRVCTCDADFKKFPFLTVVDPLRAGDERP